MKNTTNEQTQTETNFFNCIKAETLKTLNHEQNIKNDFVNISERQFNKATLKAIANSKPIKNVYITYAIDKGNKPIFDSIRIWDNITKAVKYKDARNMQGIFKFKAEAKPINE
jgi:hypothetical protein